MRMIGHLPSASSARTFSDFLFGQGIENEIEPEKNGSWMVWVRSEEEIASAKGHFERYLESPNDAKFRQAAERARIERIRKEKEDAATARIPVTREQLWPQTTEGIGHLSLALIVVCAAVSFLSSFGKELRPILPLFITESDPIGGLGQRLGGLAEIRHGQVWRLVTPIFVHNGILHLLLNALWLKSLGTMIERMQSPRVLATLVVVIAALSNIAQYLVTGPSFGGLSGVIYGLLGYAWMRGRFDPGSGLYVDRVTMGLMTFWFFFCLAGFIPAVANTVHTVGFALGLAWGLLSAFWAKRNAR